MARQRASILEIHPEHPEPRKIQQAVDRLEAGHVILYPTDSIYGLGADIAHRGAIARLYELRGLDPNKPLSLVCASLSEVSRYAVLEDECFRVMKRVLPGPYTFILRATREAPRTGDAKRRTVGIRIPAHPVATAIVRALSRPLVSTSALVPDGDEGALGPGDPRALAEHYGAQEIALVLDAGPLSGEPSTVVDWSEETPVIVRAGAGPSEALGLG